MNLGNASALAWAVAENKSLQQVKLSFPAGKFEDHYCPILLKSFLENPTIKSINLDNNNLSGDMCKRICNIILETPECNLERISLNGNCMGDKGIQALISVMEKNDTVRYLTLCNNGLSQQPLDALLHAVKAKTGCMFEVTGASVATQGGRKGPFISSDEQNRGSSDTDGQQNTGSSDTPTNSNSSGDDKEPKSV